MNFHIVGTGSKGNCYILESKHSALIIDCGMSFMDVKKSIDFQVEKIAGCIVTHQHGDHFKFVKEFTRHSIDVYANQSTIEFANYTSNNFKTIQNKKTFIVGEFTIMPFDVEHDVETFGFLIHHQDCGFVLFITDSVFCKYNFKNINHIVIESNYSDEIIDAKFGNKFVRDRVLNSHMEINQTVKTILSNDISAVGNIVLIHLSDSNSDEREFKNIVERQTGKNTTVASNGMKINFDKNLF
jgi:phosphoribosyl 1,2-cyclic phosphodiesterase